MTNLSNFMDHKLRPPRHKLNSMTQLRESPGSHLILACLRICAQVSSMTCMLHRPECSTLSKLKDMAQSLLNNKIPTVHNLASFIGFIVSNFPAAKYGQPHYRNLMPLRQTREIIKGMPNTALASRDNLVVIK